MFHTFVVALHGDVCGTHIVYVRLKLDGPVKEGNV
jgi:hypothetical protein